MTPRTALKDLQVILQRKNQLEAAHNLEMGKIDSALTKIEVYLSTHTDIKDIPEIVKEASPYLGWQIGQRTDESLFEAYQGIKSKLADIKRSVKKPTETLEGQAEQLEGVAKDLLLSRHSTGLSVAGYGSLELKPVVTYRITNKASLIDEMVSEGAESNLTITIKANSVFMAEYQAEHGRLPAGVESETQEKVSFLKN